jgi:hypothetical protein
LLFVVLQGDAIMTFNQQKAIEDYTELMRRVSVGAYEERSSYHYESGTWPDDGVEQSLYSLEKLAIKNDLEFIWDTGTQTWSLLPMSDETREARARAMISVRDEEPPGDDYESIEQHIQELNEQAEQESRDED